MIRPLALFTLLIAFAAPVAAQEPTKTADQANREALEKKFSESLSGSVLIGSFTDTSKGQAATLREEKYTISSITKVAGDIWLFNVRIQYGDHDGTVALPLPVKWADDTPMVSLTKFPVPGFGTFTARVIFYEGHYAGYWSGGDHGGHLFGRIEKAERAEEKAGK
jgi:hypothetical protein